MVIGSKYLLSFYVKLLKKAVVPWLDVFSTVKGTGQTVYDAWSAGPDAPVRHFRCPVVEHWESLNIQRVKVVLESNSTGNVELIFDGTNTDKFTWFSKSRLLSSPWNDINTEPQNYFSIVGAPQYIRSFYINRNWGGCPNDAGWLAVFDAGPQGLCEFERAPEDQLPYIRFSTTSGYANLNGDDIATADRMVISIDTPGHHVLCSCPAGQSLSEDGTRCVPWLDVFSTVKGTGQTVYDAWSAGPDAPVRHFRCPVVEHWESLNIQRVKVVLESNSTGNVELIFDGTNTDKFTWFSKSRLLSSPWNDINTEPQNYFSIVGAPQYIRSFYINRNWGGCPNDAGWLAVFDAGPQGLCEFERAPEDQLPYIRFSKTSGYANLNGDDIATADRMVISIDTPGHHVLCSCPAGQSLSEDGTRCVPWLDVFSTVKGTGQTVYDAWSAGPDAPVRHFRCPVVEHWESLNIERVKVVLESNSTGNVELIFDGTNTDKFTWFSKSRLLSSPWNDTNTEPQNYFSIVGAPQYKRSFYINRNWGGCPNDAGWLAVFDAGPQGLCEFERAPEDQLPYIRFSTTSGYANLNGDDIATADRMVISIDTPGHHVLCSCPAGQSLSEDGTRCVPWLDVFSTVKGTGQTVYDAWSAGPGAPVRHFRCPVVEHWESLNIERVKVVLESNSTGNVELIFDGTNTDKFTWFSKSRLLSSPWNDTNTEPQNYFSIVGAPQYKRSFYINRNWGGCPNDAGWLAVFDAGPQGLCEFERAPEDQLPYIRFSKTSGYANLNGDDIATADRMVISIDTPGHHVLCSCPAGQSLSEDGTRCVGILSGLTLVDAGIGHLIVSWTVVGNLPISRYRLRYQPADGSGSDQDLSPAPEIAATSATVQGLFADTEYTLTLTSFGEDDQPNGEISGTYTTDPVVVNVQCDQDSMSLSIPRAALPAVNVEDLHLLDPDCGATEDEDEDVFKFETHLQECGTRQETSGDDKFIFSNEVIANQVTYDNGAVRNQPVNLHFQCEFLRQRDVSGGAIMYNIPSPRIQIVDANNSFTIEMHMFTSEDFLATYESSDFPLQVSPSDRLHFGLSVASPLDNLELFARDCVSTPTTNPDDSPRVSIIDDGCQVDETLQKADELSNDKALYYSVAAFTFPNALDPSLVYFHCTMIICFKDDPDSRCKQGCIPPARRRRAVSDGTEGRVRRESSRDKQADITQGPFQVQSGEAGIGK
ncbi:uncharacterized protein LOC144909227 [Branchiostoma floridae x Branchiostoma belcheri]